MEIQTGEGQVQIHFTTKQQQYAIPDTPYSIAANISTDELNTLVNSLLKETGFLKNVDFDFLVLGEFLRNRLGGHLKERGVSFEDTIEIEYVERFPSPEPQDCLLHDDWVSAVHTRNNWILTGCYDHSINIWTTKGKHTLTVPGHLAPVKAVSWISLNDQNGVFVSASQDQTAMIWEWNIEQNSVQCMYVCKGHERGIDSVDVSPSGKLFATGSWDTLLKVWSADPHGTEDESSSKRARTAQAQTRTPVLTLQGHREAVSGVQWLNEQSLLTSSWDHTLKIWDLAMEGVKSEISGNKSFFDISYSQLNGLIITASADKNLRLYDPRSNQGTVVKNTFLGHTQWIQTVCWSTTDEHLFISGSYDNQVKLWDVRSSKAPLYDLIGHEDKVHDCDWSNPKYMVSGGSDNTVRVFKSKKANQKTK